MKQIELQQVSKIPSPPAGFERVSVGVSLKGEALFLYRGKQAKRGVRGYAEDPDPARLPATEAAAVFRFKLTVTDGESSEIIDLPLLGFGDHRVDLLSDGSLVIVNTRAPWKTKGKFEPNGLIYDRTSGRHREFFAGDGIAQIGVDGKDRIWVSYFDEGVYGIFGVDAGEGGSGNGERAHRISNAGLNCFDASGALIWQHDQKERFIDDCYALNVADDAAHFHFYGNFDLGTVSGDFATGYRKINLGFCRSFAISSTRALFIGGLRSSLEGAYLFSLNPAGAVGPQKCRLMSPDGRPLKRGRAVGRGSRLHVFTRKDWYCLDVAGI